MKFDWDNWNTGGKTIFVAACAAILSMFMNWVDAGIATRIGISQEAFLLLGFWVYPVVMLFNNKPINLAWGLLCAMFSFIFTAIYMATKTIELFGVTINAAAVGAWVFLCASFALGVGVLNYATDGLNESEKEKYIRPLGTVLPIILGVPGILLLILWLFSKKGEVSNIVPIISLILIGLSIALRKIYGEGRKV